MTAENESAIQIYLRPRPSRRPSPNAQIDTECTNVRFIIPRDKANGYINNQNEQYCFAFNGVFNAEATQEEVFEGVASTVIEGALTGYNGTVFAYGQTGSGKTFTITGGPERYIDRGIIPRAISMIFSEITKRTDHSYSVHVSYLEIYNDVVYDLLDPDREVKDIDDLPRVIMRENEDSNLSLINLRICKVENEEDALGLLFLGDTNRTISETPMNLASSRSHCVFSLHIQSRKLGEDIVRRSKLNLVDLAGSERIKKTGVDGETQTESRYINLSLHYLEQVIVALQEFNQGVNRNHVPYRNSAMTLLLRDSLGGNCKTVMIANISIEEKQLDESISTCRFAQRVAMISNKAVVNEELDPLLVIARLKKEIVDLKEEIKFLRGDESHQIEPSEEQREAFRTELEQYCSSVSAVLDLNKSIHLIKYGFEVMREFVKNNRNQLISYRDDKKNNRSEENLEEDLTSVSCPTHDRVKEIQKTKVELSASQKRELYEIFERDYQHKSSIKQNTKLLKDKFKKAKQEGQKLQKSKKHMTELKEFIEMKRIKRSVRNLSNKDSADEPDQEEQIAVEELTEAKAEYKTLFYGLRDLKKEIESLQSVMERSKSQMKMDFENWIAERLANDSLMHDQYINSFNSETPVAAGAVQEYLTGNQQTDKDIMTFFQTKTELCRTLNQ